MQKIIYSVFGIFNIFTLSAQNLVTNPGAESLPRGTGWTIISSGGAACATAPTNSYLNWTMIPDGSSGLYPYDHTTGVAGGVTFFSGCRATAGGPFELNQDIDVSADATDIDLGTIQYIFSGYIQTPVNNVPGGQTDQGRFIVDYLNASNIVLGTSYTSSWQSNSLGSGATWNFYTNTRIAPAGTRTVRIGLQAQVFANLPAINAYFDDISLVKATVLPVRLLSFTGKEDGGNIYLKWKVADEINLLHYELEQSSDAVNFKKIATIASGKQDYLFIDKNIHQSVPQYYYRIKIVDVDGKFSYSDVAPVNIKRQHSIMISPNPAKNVVTVSGFEGQGKISIINANGANVYSTNITTQSIKINIAHLPAGIYVLTFVEGKAISHKKLVIQN